MEDIVIGFVNNACGLPVSNRYFPGGQPVSLNRKLLRTRFGAVQEGRYSEYSLAFKADGVRALLVFLKIPEGLRAFLLYRNLRVEALEALDLPVSWAGSCFDTEVVARGDDGGRTVLIFDTVCVENHSVRDLFYPLRVEIARRFVAQKPSQNGFPLEPGEYPSNFPNALIESLVPGTHLSVKKIYRLDSLRQRRSTAQLAVTDGFVFTNNFSAYSAQDRESLFKWKPLEQITVDFAVGTLQGGEHPAVLPREYRTYQVCGEPVGLWIEDQLVSTGDFGGTLPTTGKIYECEWTGQGWRALLERPDKTHSNSFQTFLKTLENIDENIGLGEVENQLQPRVNRLV